MSAISKIAKTVLPLAEAKNHSTKDWFVVCTLSRQEKKVAKLLAELGYNVYLPIVKTLRVWSDRKKKVEMPLIPSMLFVEDVDIDKRLIYSVPGFHSILKLQGKIGKVKPREIEQLKIITGEMSEVETVENIRLFPGDEIEIIGGPLQGYYAQAIEEVNSFRVLIQVETLNLGYVVNLAKNQVRKVK